MSSASESLRSFQCKEWTVEMLVHQIERGKLDPSPPYQRRTVWGLRDKIKLVQSIVMRYPMGALTVLEERNKYSDASFQVIDGKQRVSAIADLIINQTVKLSHFEINEMTTGYRPFSELVPSEALARNSGGPFGWSDLSPDLQERIRSYPISVIVLAGTVQDAQDAFERMNSTVYRLEPQEIRNAVYAGYPVLDASIRLSEETWKGFERNPLVSWRVVAETGVKRMADVQLYAELMLLLRNGPQHRRDSLNGFFASVRPNSASGIKEVARLESQLRKIFRQMSQVFGCGDLQEFGFPRNSELEFYSLVFAFARRRFTQPQLNRFASDMRSAVSSFRGLVDDAGALLKTGSSLPVELDDENIRLYAGTILSGQKNSMGRRTQRADILEKILREVVGGAPDRKRQYSDYERRKIWRRSEDKRCARCREVVAWENYHAGHATPHALSGPTIVENGRVECKTCNTSAGAT